MNSTVNTSCPELTSKHGTVIIVVYSKGSIMSPCNTVFKVPDKSGYPDFRVVQSAGPELNYPLLCIPAALDTPSQCNSQSVLFSCSLPPA